MGTVDEEGNNDDSAVGLNATASTSSSAGAGDCTKSLSPPSSSASSTSPKTNSPDSGASSGGSPKSGGQEDLEDLDRLLRTTKISPLGKSYR